MDHQGQNQNVSLEKNDTNSSTSLPESLILGLFINSDFS